LGFQNDCGWGCYDVTRLSVALFRTITYKPKQLLIPTGADY
jgi:hypothetical protein